MGCVKPQSKWHMSGACAELGQEKQPTAAAVLSATLPGGRAPSRQVPDVLLVLRDKLVTWGTLTMAVGLPSSIPS